MFTVENSGQQNKVLMLWNDWCPEKLEWKIKKYQNFFFFSYISCLEMLSANSGCRWFYGTWIIQGVKTSAQIWIQRTEPTMCAQMITFGQPGSVQ